MEFFAPLLTYLGYSVDQSDSPALRVNLSRATGNAVNIWQAQDAFKNDVFEVYAPGLHHVCFNVDSKGKIDELADLVPQWGGRITDPPADYPYTSHGTYYALYFRGPDDLKFECVYMSELERLHRANGTLEIRLWQHADG